MSEWLLRRLSLGFSLPSRARRERFCPTRQAAGDLSLKTKWQEAQEIGKVEDVGASALLANCDGHGLTLVPASG